MKTDKDHLLNVKRVSSSSSSSKVGGRFLNLLTPEMEAKGCRVSSHLNPGGNPICCQITSHAISHDPSPRSLPFFLLSSVHPFHSALINMIVNTYANPQKSALSDWETQQQHHYSPVEWPLSWMLHWTLPMLCCCYFTPAGERSIRMPPVLFGCRLNFCRPFSSAVES